MRVEGLKGSPRRFGEGLSRKKGRKQNVPAGIWPKRRRNRAGWIDRDGLMRLLE